MPVRLTLLLGVVAVLLGSGVADARSEVAGVATRRTAAHATAATRPRAGMSAATPKFLTLPFASLSHMHVQQAWDFANGQHQAIDYIKGTVDNTSTWKGFPVVAAADGTACGERLGHNGCVVRPGVMGNRVMIRHKVDGVVYFTFYNHLQWIDSSIPIGDRHHRVAVKRGQVIGYAGHSGNPSYLIHLHFQLLDARSQPLDPYGIYGNRTQYPDPKGSNGKRSRRRNYWTTNPPTLAPVPTATAVPAAGATADRDPAAGPAQAATAPAPATPPLSGGAAAAGPQYVTHGRRTRKWIALTFDADMYPFMYRTRNTYHEYDPRLLKLLTENAIPATIFFNGLYAKAYPNVVARLAAEPDIEVANHTWDHAGWTSTCGNTDPIRAPMTKRKEVARTSTILQSVTGINDRYFRFPGGCYGSGDTQLVKSLGETPIGWDCYFGDALGWSTAKQVANVKRTCTRGSIVITHFNNTRYHPGVYKALKELLPWWRSHGWTIVNVGKLLGRPKPPPG